MKRYDAAIVGSGPAGMASASVLASAGMSVALIDRDEFPRDKLCGGLLSGRARSALDDIFPGSWDQAMAYESRGARFFFEDRLISSVDSLHPVHIISRKTFDAHLLEQTAKTGPDLFLGTPVLSVDTGRGVVSLRGGPPLQADFIIGADGVTSRVAKALFPRSFRKHEHAVCLQADIPWDGLPGASRVPDIYFGCVRWGYGWVFPKNGSLSIGLGGLLSQNRDLKDRFRQFYRQVTGREPRGVRSHYLPCGNYRKIPGAGNVLLAGDAAGLVEPITGEGIAFALMSGKLAAQAVLQAARAGAPHKACELYLPGYKEIISLFSPAKALRFLVFSKLATPLFIRELSRAEWIVRDYFALVAGQTSYGRLALKALRWKLGSWLGLS